MSDKILGELLQDPAFLYFMQNFSDKKEVEMNVDLLGAKLGLNEGGFKLESLAMTGHIHLMQCSKKYGALLLVYNKSLLIIQNAYLGQLTQKGTLPDDFNSILSFVSSPKLFEFNFILERASNFYISEWPWWRSICAAKRFWTSMLWSIINSKRQLKEVCLWSRREMEFCNLRWISGCFGEVD